MKDKLIILILLMGLSLTTSPAYSEDSALGFDSESVQDFLIDHADLLEFLKDRVILNGDVSISGTGENAYTLVTPRLESIKDARGDFSLIETFGVSRLVSEKYVLVAEKMYFRKVNGTRFNQLEAIGSIRVEGVDQKQKLTADKVIFDLDTKELHAKGNVYSEQLVEMNGKLSLARLKADDQIIKLFGGQSSGLSRQIEAKGHTHTEFDGVRVQSEKTDFYALGDKTEKVIFTGGANLATSDNVKASGEQIEYFLNDHLIKIRSRTNLVPSSKPENASLLVPFTDRDGKASQMNVQAEYIENQELIAGGKSLLQAEQTSNASLVRLDYQTQRGYGRQLFIVQDKTIPDQKGDFLYLIDKAKIIDLTNKQILEAPFIKIGLGDRSLMSGITGKAHGVVLLKQEASPTGNGASAKANAQKSKRMPVKEGPKGGVSR